MNFGITDERLVTSGCIFRDTNINYMQKVHRGKPNAMILIPADLDARNLSLLRKGYTIANSISSELFHVYTIARHSYEINTT